MSGKESQQFRLGDWLVEPALGRVSRGDERAGLRPREMDLLVYMAARPREVLKTDDIIRDVWAGVHVTNDSLYFSISQLRKVLDEKGAGGSVIETIPKRGYRLMAEVSQVQSDEPPAANDDAVTARPISAGPISADAREVPAASVESRVKDDNPDDGQDLGQRAVKPDFMPYGKRSWLAIAAAVVVAAGLLWVVLPRDRAEGPSASIEPPPAVETVDASSIAVMPFIDLTPETDYTYFSDGITEEILNRLTRIQGLRVAARTSSFTFKDSSADVIEIGRSLGVANLLEGSVRKEGDRVRIAVQLIDATTGFQLWSDSYDRQLTSVFEIQNEISRRVADALEITLASNGVGDRADHPASADVLDDYLLGLEALRTQTFESLARAVEHFETVLERDPSFAGARVQWAAANLELLNTGASGDLDRARRAESILQAVIDEDPGNAPAHRVMGVAKKWLFKSEEARRELDLALQLAPSDSEAMVQLAHLKNADGDVVQSRQLLERALRIDPFSNNVLRSNAVAQRQFGATEQAEEALRRAVQLHPNNPNSVWQLGSLQAGDKGRIARGLDSYRMAAELDADDYEIAAYVAATYQTLEMPEEAQPWISRAEESGPEAVTTKALRAIEASLRGDDQAAMTMSLEALEMSSHRIYSHSPITSTLLPMVARGAVDGGGLEDAIRRLEALQATHKLIRDELHRRVGMESLLAFSELNRAWLVSLAVLYEAAGMDDKFANALDGLALTRIDNLGEYRDALRNDDYLLEAEVLALQGDTDGAFQMLGRAIDNELIYMWQFNYAKNPALASLQADPRWDRLMAKVQVRIAEERQLVTTALGMVKSAEEAD